MPARLSWNLSGFPVAQIKALKPGVAWTHNVRQYLYGPKASRAVISLVPVSGDDPRTHGFTIAGGFLLYDGSPITGGSFNLKATV